MQNPNPNWINLSVCCQKDQAEQISDWLFDQGALSVTFGDPFDNTPDEQAIFEPDPLQTPIWDTTQVIGLFDSADLGYVKKMFQDAFSDVKLNLIETALQDKVWETAWLEHYQPIIFGEKDKQLWVGPEQMLPPEKATAVFLNPGLAFGTGTHPTTALCLAWLAENPPKEKSVIDYGSGSGILAIAALKLGAKQVIAVDHCEQALLSTLENGKRNQVPQDSLCVYSPEDFSLQKAIHTQCDLLLANILIDPLIQLAPKFATYVKSNGTIVLSGLLNTQLSALKTAYEPWFNFDLPPNTQEDWVCIMGKRK